ncbi:MAG: hypothetical protein EZS28_032302 [Streblomastix strix]|uniref:Uncharacterized protein n=1 Tax=Streblomastix strix TaxID=222440 RepID=A0A5J4UQA0_9EUKA|nr:MAG: hypothetical protein EZS28_032302 [Streblomastix strix]
MDIPHTPALLEVYASAIEVFQMLAIFGSTVAISLGMQHKLVHHLTYSVTYYSNQSKLIGSVALRIVSQSIKCLHNMVNQGLMLNQGLCINADFGSAVIKAICTCGGLVDGQDSLIIATSNLIKDLFYFLFRINTKPTDTVSVIGQQEQIENDGGNEEIESHIFHQFTGIQTQNRNDISYAKKMIQNVFIHPNNE